MIAAEMRTRRSPATLRAKKQKKSERPLTRGATKVVTLGAFWMVLGQIRFEPELRLRATSDGDTPVSERRRINEHSRHHHHHPGSHLPRSRCRHDSPIPSQSP